jgi:hypothetical protein
MAKREDAWSWTWPWQPDDAEPPFPVRGVPGGWGESWELADREQEARWRAQAEAEERQALTVVAAEREASAP